MIGIQRIHASKLRGSRMLGNRAQSPAWVLVHGYNRPGR